MVGNDRLGNGGTNGIDLCRDTSTLDSDTDIESREFVLSNNQDRLENLQTKDLGLDVLNWLSIDLDQSPALLSKGNSGSRLLPERNKRNKEGIVRNILRNHSIQYYFQINENNSSSSSYNNEFRRSIGRQVDKVGTFTVLPRQLRGWKIQFLLLQPLLLRHPILFLITNETHFPNT